MKSRHQGRTLAARGHIAASEVGDHVNARKFRDPRGVIKLQRPAFFGAVADCLAVNARRRHFHARNVGFVQKFMNGLRVEFRKRHGHAARAVNFVVARRAQA